MEPEPAEEVLAVRGLERDGNAIRGMAVNQSGEELRDVAILIQYYWLWRDEFDPEPSRDPSFAVYHQLEQPIAPGEHVTFSYRPPAQKAARDREDGTFDILVSAGSFRRQAEESAG